jgi:hypothetical protein
MHIAIGCLAAAFALFIAFGAGSGWYRARSMRAELVACLLVFAAVAFAGLRMAVAQTAAPATTVSLAPWVNFVAPYVNLILPPIVTALVGWAVFKFQQWTNIKIEASAVASIKSAAATSAGVMVAGAEDNLAGKTINVGSPGVAAAANAVIAALPKLTNLVGADTDSVSRIVVGEIGKIQAGQSLAVVDAAPLSK